MAVPEEIRAKSKSLLEGAGIPVYDNLPYLDIGRVRNERDAASRLVILYVLGALLEGVAPEKLMSWLDAEGFASHLSPREASFLSGRRLTQAEENELSWKQESLFVLSWAGGLVEELGLPVAECDLTDVFPQIPRAVSVAEFMNGYRLRSRVDILLALDIHYCIHHTLRHQELWPFSSIPGGLHETVAIERRTALEWLADANAVWDDITLDT